MIQTDAVQRFWQEIVNGRRLDVIDELMTSDYRQHAAGIDQGPGGVREFLRDLFATSDGMHADVTGVLTVDDLVITTTTVTFRRPPDGWQASNQIVDVFRVRDGRLAEHWDIAPYSPPTD